MPAVDRKDSRYDREEPEQENWDIERRPADAHLSCHDALGHPGDETDEEAEVEEDLFFKSNPLERQASEKNWYSEEEEHEHTSDDEIECFGRASFRSNWPI